VGVAIGTLAAKLYRTVYLAWYLSRNIIFRSLTIFFKYLLIDSLSAVGIVAATRWIQLTSVDYIAWFLMAAKVFAISCIVSIFIYSIFNPVIIYKAISGLSKRQDTILISRGEEDD